MLRKNNIWQLYTTMYNLYIIIASIHIKGDRSSDLDENIQCSFIKKTGKIFLHAWPIWDLKQSLGVL